MDFAEFWRASLLQNISSRSFLDNPYTFSTLFCCLCLCSYQGAPRDHAGKYMFSEPPQVLVHTYERVMNVCFFGKCDVIFSCNTRFEILPFVLLATKYQSFSDQDSLREHCPHSDWIRIFAVEVFSKNSQRLKAKRSIWISLDSILMQENADQKNFEYGYFLRY